MSILMDGRVITQLELHGADGSVVTKNLVERSSGSVKSAEGYHVQSGVTIYGNNAKIEIENVSGLDGCTSFVVMLQLVESGLLATPGDPTSEVTMYPYPQTDDVTHSILSHALLCTGDFDTFDDTIQYPKAFDGRNCIAQQISTGTTGSAQMRKATVSLSGNTLTVAIPSADLGRNSLYLKYKYTVYGM